MGVLRKTTALVLILLGLIGAFVSFLAVLDPVGAQLANDGAPFTEPPSLVMPLLLTFAHMGLSGFGFWLFRFRPRGSASRA